MDNKLGMERKNRTMQLVKGIIRNILKIEINRNSELLENRDLLKEKARLKIEEMQYNTVNANKKVKIKIILGVFDKKFDEIYEELRNIQNKKSNMVGLFPGETIQEKANNFNNMIREFRGKIPNEVIKRKEEPKIDDKNKEKELDVITMYNGGSHGAWRNSAPKNTKYTKKDEENEIG